VAERDGGIVGDGGGFEISSLGFILGGDIRCDDDFAVGSE
jgi:hypothetical protein